MAITNRQDCFLSGCAKEAGIVAHRALPAHATHCSAWHGMILARQNAKDQSEWHSELIPRSNGPMAQSQNGFVMRGFEKECMLY